MYMRLYVIGFTCTHYFTFDAGEKNIDPIEQPRQMRRQKYVSLPEEEKERKRAMARENYKRWKGKTQNLDFDIQNYNRVKLDTFMKMDAEREHCLAPTPASVVITTEATLAQTDNHPRDSLPCGNTIF